MKYKRGEVTDTLGQIDPYPFHLPAPIPKKI